MSRRILLVEDDRVLADILRHNLEHEGFEVARAPDGDEALAMANTFAPDVVLLDVMIPGINGFTLCAHWRHEHRFPVIMITALDQKMDQLQGFESGADDYVTKPFDLETLLARIRAVLRRSRPTVNRVELGTVTIDFTSFVAKRGSTRIELTRREFELLRYLAERANTIVFREELLRGVWRYPGEPFTRSVDKAILRLRKKIEPDPHHPLYIQTSHGDGYYLSVSESGAADRTGDIQGERGRRR